MSRIAIVAALPGELKPMVRGWRHTSHSDVDLWRWKHDEGEWIAACAGAGVSAATRAFAAIEAGGPIAAVVSVGWAGALRLDCKVGTVYGLSGVIDARTGERFGTAGSGMEECWLVTSTRVAGEAEKQRLATSYNADLVDMEAAGVARMAAMRQIPFFCIKGISDGFTDQLPDFNRFLTPTGGFLLGRFVLFALFRPWYWPALMRMNENSKKAAQGIATSLLDFLDERGHIRERNGYPNFRR